MEKDVIFMKLTMDKDFIKKLRKFKVVITIIHNAIVIKLFHVFWFLFYIKDRK